MSQFNRLRHRHLQRQINRLKSKDMLSEDVTRTLEDVYELLEHMLEIQEKRFKGIEDKLTDIVDVAGETRYVKMEVGDEDRVPTSSTSSKKRRRMSSDSDVAVFIPDITVSDSKVRIKEDSISSTKVEDMKSSISALDDILGGE